MGWHKGQRPDRKGWAVVRLKVFERDGWRCVDCGKAGRLECDHRIPMGKSKHHPLDMKNLQSLCRGCHIAKTAIENRPPPTKNVTTGKHI